MVSLEASVNFKNTVRYGRWGIGPPDCPSLTFKRNQSRPAKNVMVFAAKIGNEVFWRFIPEKLTADVYRWLLDTWLIPLLKRRFPYLVVPHSRRPAGQPPATPAGVEEHKPEDNAHDIEAEEAMDSIDALVA